MIIYKVTNKINNKVYIGQTKRCLSVRKSEHYRPSNKHCVYLHRALFYWSKDVFEWRVIYTTSSIKDLNEKEQYFISLFDSTNPDKGYNLTTGGLNFIMKDESKKKMSDYAKNRIYNDEYRKNLREAHLGNKNWNYGKNHKSETIKKMELSAANRKKIFNFTLIDPNGIKYENIINIELFCKNNNLDKSGVYRRSNYKGWKILKNKVC